MKKRPGSTTLLAALLLVVSYGIALAQAASSSQSQQQLQQPKRFCDESLIAQTIYSEKQRQVVGLSPPAASPSSAASELKEGERAPQKSWGFLGIVVEPIAAETARRSGLAADEGAVATSVLQDGSAEQAGLKAGDIVVALVDEIVRNADGFRHTQAPMSPDTLVPVQMLGAAGEETAIDLSVPDKGQYPPSREYVSPIGFIVTLPAGWSVVTAREVERGMGYVADQLGSKAKGVLSHVKRISQQMEIFANLTDAVTVVSQRIALPPTSAKAQQTCASIAATRTKTTGRPIRTYDCGVRKFGDLSAFCMELDGTVPRKIMRQCWIARPKAGTIRFTIVFGDDQLQQQTLVDFEQMLTSIAWP